MISNPAQYEGGRERLLDRLLADFAFGEGRLAWSRVSHHADAGDDRHIDTLLEAVACAGGGTVVAYDHSPHFEGLFTVHVLAPALLDDLRVARETEAEQGAGPRPNTGAVSAQDACPPPDERRILFAGPSIRGLSLQDNIEIRPPAVCGDLARLLVSPPAAVALIDGCFKLAPSVWHREILDLIAAGTVVLGGASLGALRAAELDRRGMIGIGSIFEAYRDGALVRDDAVMLDHGPAEMGHMPLTVALVDAEDALVQFDIPAKVLRMMQRILRTTPYQRRDWRYCLARYEERTGIAFPVALAELEHAPSLKVADARSVIAALSQWPVAANEKPPITARPPLTRGYRRVLARSV